MDLETLMEECRKLSAADRRRLLAFLASLRAEPGYVEETAGRLDDTSPGRWFTLEEVKKRYADDLS